MITKKIGKGMKQKLLRIIYEKYVDEFGHGVRNLRQFPVLITAQESYHEKMPELMESQDNARRSLFLDVMKELRADGFIFYDEGVNYYLTAEGYEEADMGWLKRSLRFFNANQGLAVPISIISLIVSVIALFVAGS